MTGRFYVFEGIDGIGKSTQAGLLAEHLKRRGETVLLVREPGATPLGEKLRSILLEPASGDLSPEVEMFLFMAARAHLCRSRIAPALDRGEVVISDRFTWSTVVYQGIVGGLDVADVLRAARLATSGLEPVRTFLIDGDPATSPGRLEDGDRLESRGVAFQERVRDGFLQVARDHPGEIAVIDGSGTRDEVHERVLAALPR